MLPSFLGRDLLVQYPTTVVAVVFLILVWRNTHDLLKIAVEGGNILISDPQSNLRHGIIGGIEQFIGFLDSHYLPNLDAMIENFDKALSHPDADDLERLKQAVR